MPLVTPATERAPLERELATLARAVLDDHWAVAAIPAERRQLLLERAESAALMPGEGLGDPIADGLALLETAYELAALGQLEAALDPTPGMARDLAQAVLTLGAARAFRCAAALRPPTEDPEALLKWALRMGAMATVARQPEAFQRWWEVRHHAADALRDAAARLEGAPWDLYARGTLWLAWLGLLGAPVTLADRQPPPERLPLLDTRHRLAMLRERRPRPEPGDAEDGVASAAALRARMTDFAIRHLADATELVTVAVVRRTLPDVSGEVRLHLSAARAALAGDHGVDLLLAWLQAAGVTLAGGVTAQLELPGL
ncbi:MAG: hypothetical protein KJT01_09830 [Gemmatimonadetes bacterium]|nr:hypothetical protein [Gemmatimonadota bacterium]